MTDSRRLTDPFAAALKLPQGSGIILRHYNFADRYALAKKLMALCRLRKLFLLVGADWRLAWQIGAHGVHLPEWQLTRNASFPRKPGWIITAATHSHTALFRAKRFGVDAALVSPVFATSSHTRAKILGPIRLARLVRTAGIPVYALGGITSRNAQLLSNSGATGFAAISGLAP